ncbi:hypothetical protein TNCT_519711 [Trichonephila clavata]|uniref:Uncharacterized protein n=1 Tax=Trichonephila clavata TaxID=2740835 RepID=A0A8X6LSE5_TRICU|nr:hypothetical protein TNCT_519711 [Trichonephila clavata]
MFKTSFSPSKLLYCLNPTVFPIFDYQTHPIDDCSNCRHFIDDRRTNGLALQRSTSPRSGSAFMLLIRHPKPLSISGYVSHGGNTPY